MNITFKFGESAGWKLTVKEILDKFNVRHLNVMLSLFKNDVTFCFPLSKHCPSDDALITISAMYGYFNTSS